MTGSECDLYGHIHIHYLYCPKASPTPRSASEGWGERLLFSLNASAKMYKLYRDALAKQAHPIQYSLCIWGRANVWLWGPRVVGIDLFLVRTAINDTQALGSLVAYV